MPKECYYY
ncbi:uncharacterized protein FFM5_15335 [Fusarium fujikuroi]|nr:uncharacterized protein FFM5_15335 [Fusarium fujikuroi]